MKRYSEELKTKALERIKEVGVKQTSEEMELSVPTLYKWRNEGAGGKAAPGKRTATKGIGTNYKATGENADDVLRILQEDDTLDMRIRQLEEENENLRKTVARMKKALLAICE